MTKTNAEKVQELQDISHSIAMSSVVSENQFKKSVTTDAVARQQMNVLKSVVPLVSAAISTDNEDDFVAVAEMIKEVKKTSDLLLRRMEKIGIDFSLKDNSWRPYIIREIVSEFVAKNWEVNGISTIGWINHLWDLVLSVDIDGLDDLDPQFPYMPDEIALRLSALKAINPVVHEVETFSFYHTQDYCLRHAVQKIGQTANEYVKMVCDGGKVSAKTRRIYRQAMLNHCGKLYATSWRVEAKSAIDELKGLRKPDLRRKLNEYAESGGISLDAVDGNFKDAVARLHIVSDMWVKHSITSASEGKG